MNQELSMLVAVCLALLLGVLMGWYFARARLQDRLAQRFSPIENSVAQTQSLTEQLQLASTWRDQGFYDQAIALHQNLLIEAQSPEDECSIRFQLALDFFSAGLFDRAESLWLGLLVNKEFHLPALTQLSRLYTMTQDWQALVKLLADTSLTEELSLVYLHACCELVQYFRGLSLPNQADKYLQMANKLDAKHPRVRLLSGVTDMLEVKQAKHESWQDLLVTKRFTRAQDFRQLLRRAAQQGADWQAVYQQLEFRGVLADRFQCRHCGYESREHSWLCPQCHHWQTMDEHH